VELPCWRVFACVASIRARTRTRTRHPMAEPSEADELPEEIGQRDEAAFDRLFDVYFDPLRRYVYHYLRSWDEADDVVHDLFARLWERWRELPVTDFKAYVYTSARNRALTRLRHRAIEHRWCQVHEGPVRADAPSSPPDPERELIAAETSAALQCAVDALPPRQREVILRRWAGESHQQIAAALGISPNTVSEHMNRALRHLRQALGHLLR